MPPVHFCCCLDGHPPQASGGAFHRVSTVQSPGSRIDWEQRHFRCDGRRVRVSWCSAGQLQLQRHREAHLFVQWVRDDDGITYMIMNVPFKPSRIVTSEGYLVVFVWSFPALHLQLALRCASRLIPNRSPSHTLSHMPTTTRTTDTKYKPCVGQSNS